MFLPANLAKFLTSAVATQRILCFDPSKSVDRLFCLFSVDFLKAEGGVLMMADGIGWGLMALGESQWLVCHHSGPTHLFTRSLSNGAASS